MQLSPKLIFWHAKIIARIKNIYFSVISKRKQPIFTGSVAGRLGDIAIFLFHEFLTVFQSYCQCASFGLRNAKECSMTYRQSEMYNREKYFKNLQLQSVSSRRNLPPEDSFWVKQTLYYIAKLGNILNDNTKRTSHETDRLSHEKKQFREIPTAVKGTLCTRLIYLRFKKHRFLGRLWLNMQKANFAKNMEVRATFWTA